MLGCSQLREKQNPRTGLPVFEALYRAGIAVNPTMLKDKIMTAARFGNLEGSLSLAKAALLAGDIDAAYQVEVEAFALANSKKPHQAWDAIANKFQPDERSGLDPHLWHDIVRGVLWRAGSDGVKPRAEVRRALMRASVGAYQEAHRGGHDPNEILIDMHAKTLVRIGTWADAERLYETWASAGNAKQFGRVSVALAALAVRSMAEPKGKRCALERVQADAAAGAKFGLFVHPRVYAITLRALINMRAWEDASEVLDQALVASPPLTESALATAVQRRWQTGAKKGDDWMSARDGMLAVYNQAGRHEDVLRIWQEIRADPSRVPMTATLESLIYSYGNAGDFDGLRAAVVETVAAGVSVTTGVFNAMLDVCVKTGRLDDVDDLSQSMADLGVKPSGRTHQLLLRAARDLGYPPASIARVAALAADTTSPVFNEAFHEAAEVCRRHGRFDLMDSLMDRVEAQTNYRPNIITCNMTMTVFAHAGDTERMARLVAMMGAIGVSPGEVTLNIMINGLGNARRVAEVPAILDRFAELHVQPTVYTLNVAVGAYASVLYLEDMQAVFRRLTTEYGIEPDLITFCTLPGVLVGVVVWEGGFVLFVLR